MNRTLYRGAAMGLAMIGIFSCSDNTISGADGLSSDDLSADAARVATVTVSIASTSIAVGDTTRSTAVLRDYRNRIVARVVSWSSSNPAVAIVDSTGLITGMSPGTATIKGSGGNKSGTANITVTASGTPSVAPVATVSVAFGASSLTPGQTTQAIATARDSAGNVLTGRAISWSSSNNAVATVSSSALVTAVATGNSQITASSEGKSGSATITVSSTPPPTTNPGTVTDLKVSAIDSNAVTIAFTQVNDGTGQPAEYDPRYAVAPISWGSATSTTSGTCTTPVAGTAIGSPLTCKILGLKPSTNYQFQLIAFRGTLNQNAVFGSVSNVISATTKASSVATPPPPPSGSSNEPAGMTFVAERSFSALQEGSWYTNTDLSIVQDATAPKSPSGVLRATFPAGYAGGTSPGPAELNFSRYKTLYVSYWAKYSANWQGHLTGINKHAYAWVNGTTSSFVMEAEGYGSGALKPRPILQSMVVGDGPYPPNLVPGATITRDTWFHIEIVIVGNSSGRADGSMDIYLDGVHVTSATGLQWSSGAAQFNIFQFYPIWGGITDVVKNSMWFEWDHVYISGKN